MAISTITQEDFLKSTLLHIQMKRCQYIDNFPETVASVFESMCKGNRLKPYDEVKGKLYKIKTSFFNINRNRVKKRDFYVGLYDRISRRIKR
jgi:hypothetical protein